jgi:hypothetical protein
MAKTRTKTKTNGKHKPTDYKYTSEQYHLLAPVLNQNPPIVELHITSLRVDNSYQDRPREKMVAQIVQNFSEALLGIAVIAERPDGTLYVVDGETRRQAMLEMGMTSRRMRCQVFKTMGSKQEALLFSLLNSNQSRRPIKLLQKMQAYYKAGIDGGLGEAVHECGFSFERGKTQLRGPDFIRKAWELDRDGTVMKKSLLGARHAWGDAAFTVHGYIFLGIALLFKSQLPRPIDAQVRRALKGTTPTEIVDEMAKKYVKHGGRNMHLHPHEQAKMVAGIIGGMVNKSRSSEPKLDLDRLD